MKRKIIVGNWKMNPLSNNEAVRIFKAIKKTSANLSSTHVVMCPPFVYIQKFASSRSKSPASIGAQNVYHEEQGSFTGEISALMLKDMGVTHIIIGHSERRAMGETDEIVSAKVKSVLNAGIHPVVCVGEIVRDEQALYLDTLRNQIRNSLAGIQKKFIPQIIIAYEPVWAIDAKEPMDPATIEETTIFVRKVLSDIFGHDEALRTPVLYGGSINFRNAPDIMTRGKVDGLLVGRESVNVPGFVELVKAVDKI